MKLTPVQKRLLKIMAKGHAIILDDRWQYWCGDYYKTVKNDFVRKYDTGTLVEKSTIRALQKKGILDKNIDQIGLIYEINLTEKGKEIVGHLETKEKEK